MRKRPGKRCTVSPVLGRRTLGLLAGSPLPARWFYPSPPPEQRRAATSGALSIEIVSHCWRYSRLLAYQLSSLIDHPVREARVSVTVFHAREDAPTVDLLAFIGAHEVPNIRWNWQTLPPERLFRRAIGRNLAARASSADWVWFTDCDLTFQAGCLDGLNAALQGRRDALLHPRVEAKTDAYAADGDAPGNALETPTLLRADPDAFVTHPVTRATGPLQITHGDVARAVGYCDAVQAYQRPAPRWQKCDEDRVFRWLLDTPGTPIDVPGVCRVQHVDKGRYDASSSSAGLRKRVRGLQDRRRKRRRRSGPADADRSADSGHR